MDWWAIFLASAGAFAASWAGTMFLIRALSRGKILDHPNERSSHIIAVPTLLAAAGIGGTEVYWILVATLVLAAVSWIDDLRGLPASLRLPVRRASARGAATASSPASG